MANPDIVIIATASAQFFLYIQGQFNNSIFVDGNEAISFFYTHGITQSDDFSDIIQLMRRKIYLLRIISTIFKLKLSLWEHKKASKITLANASMMLNKKYMIHIKSFKYDEISKMFNIDIFNQKDILENVKEFQIKNIFHFYKQVLPIQPKNAQKISDLAQKAVIAHRILQSIRNQKFLTNSQIVSMSKEQLQKLNQNIRPIGEQLFFKPINEEGFEKHNYESIMNIFKYGYGLRLSQIPFPQFQYASNMYLPENSIKGFVFFPTSKTSKLFQCVLQQKGRSLIYGQKGIGKSSSCLLLWYLTSIITDFLVKQRQNAFEIYDLIDRKQLIKTPKILYVIANKCKNFQTKLMNMLVSQCRQLDFEQLEQKSVSSLAQFIAQEYQKRGIEVKLVIDQAQAYYKTIQQKIEVSVKQLTEFFNNISIVTSYSEWNQFQQQYKEQFNIQLWHQNPFNYSCPIRKLHPEQRHTQQYEQVETGLIVWFQIIRKLVNKGIVITDDLLRKLYQGFKPYNKYAHNWKTKRQNNWSSETHQSLTEIDNIRFSKLVNNVKTQWAFLYKKIPLKYAEYYDMRALATPPSPKFTDYYIHSFIKKDYLKSEYTNYRLQAQVVLSIIYRTTCEEVQTDRSFAERSDKYRLPKENLPTEMLQCTPFNKIIDQFIIIDNDQYYVNVHPKRIKSSLKQFVAQSEMDLQKQ